MDLYEGKRTYHEGGLRRRRWISDPEKSPKRGRVD
jgi:hypothetical protein